MPHTHIFETLDTECGNLYGDAIDDDEYSAYATPTPSDAAAAIDAIDAIDDTHYTIDINDIDTSPYPADLFDISIPPPEPALPRPAAPFALTPHPPQPSALTHATLAPQPPHPSALTPHPPQPSALTPAALTPAALAHARLTPHAKNILTLVSKWHNVKRRNIFAKWIAAARQHPHLLHVNPCPHPAKPCYIHTFFTSYLNMRIKAQTNPTHTTHTADFYAFIRTTTTILNKIQPLKKTAPPFCSCLVKHLLLFDFRAFANSIDRFIAVATTTETAVDPDTHRARKRTRVNSPNARPLPPAASEHAQPRPKK